MMCDSTVSRPGTATHRLSGSGDLLLDALHAGEGTARLPVPVSSVVEIALKGVHDTVQPCRERRLLPLDDLVGLLPRAGRQEVDGLGEGIHGTTRIGAVHAGR